MAKLFFRPDGTVEALYTESVDLSAIGAVDTVERASCVEPHAFGQKPWTADLSPVGGPLLGPFKKRSTALLAEAEWLNAWLAAGKPENFTLEVSL